MKRYYFYHDINRYNTVDPTTVCHGMYPITHIEVVYIYYSIPPPPHSQHPPLHLKHTRHTLTSITIISACVISATNNCSYLVTDLYLPYTFEEDKDYIQYKFCSTQVIIQGV